MTGINDFGNLHIWAGIAALALYLTRITARELKMWRAVSKVKISDNHYSPVRFDQDTWWYEEDESLDEPLGRIKWLYRAIRLYLLGNKRTPTENWWPTGWEGDPTWMRPKRKGS